MVLGENFISNALVVVVIGMCLDASFSQPVSYKEPGSNKPVEITTTPKRIKDVFQLNKQVMPIPQNESKKSLPHKAQFVAKLKNGDMAYEPVTYKVKAAKMGDKPSKQNDDDDDDDDGGEYDGAADYASCKKKEQEEPEEKKSMPMMIIRGFDLMAMDVPVPSGRKECKNPNDERRQETATSCNKDELEDDDNHQDQYGDKHQCQTTHRNSCSYKEEVPKDIRDRDSGEPRDVKDPTDKNKGNTWSEWSPCSKSCGEGVQARSRIKSSGSPDTQFRTCFLADCRSEPRLYDSARMASSAYEQRQLLKN